MNGIFLWRASLSSGRYGGWGAPINTDLMDNSVKRSVEERKRMERHEKEREKYLHLGLQQLL